MALAVGERDGQPVSQVTAHDDCRVVIRALPSLDPIVEKPSATPSKIFCLRVVRDRGEPALLAAGDSLPCDREERFRRLRDAAGSCRSTICRSCGRTRRARTVRCSRSDRRDREHRGGRDVQRRQPAPGVGHRSSTSARRTFRRGPRMRGRARVRRQAAPAAGDWLARDRAPSRGQGTARTANPRAEASAPADRHRRSALQRHAALARPEDPSERVDQLRACLGRGGHPGERRSRAASCARPAGDGAVVSTSRQSRRAPTGSMSASDR